MNKNDVFKKDLAYYDEYPQDDPWHHPGNCFVMECYECGKLLEACGHDHTKYKRLVYSLCEGCR